MELIYRYDPYQPIELATPDTTAAALAALQAGNARFVEFVERMYRATLGEDVESPIVIPVSPVSLGLPLWRTAVLDQAPFGLVVGCSDARAPVEQIFDQSFNSLFVVRIAGNVLGTECLGSVDYAVRNLKSLKVVLVLGHGGCGAVTAAVETYLRPGDFSAIAFTHALRSLVDRVMVSVRGAATALQIAAGKDVKKHPNYRTALIDLSVYLNAAVTAFDLHRELSAREDGLQVVYGVYALNSLRVHSAPDDDAATESQRSPTFGNAPRSTEEFQQLAQRLAKRVLEVYLGE